VAEEAPAAESPPPEAEQAQPEPPPGESEDAKTAE
jgi:hypothetical protein